MSPRTSRTRPCCPRRSPERSSYAPPSQAPIFSRVFCLRAVPRAWFCRPPGPRSYCNTHAGRLHRRYPSPTSAGRSPRQTATALSGSAISRLAPGWPRVFQHTHSTPPRRVCWGGPGLRAALPPPRPRGSHPRSAVTRTRAFFVAGVSSGPPGHRDYLMAGFSNASRVRFRALAHCLRNPRWDRPG